MCNKFDEWGIAKILVAAICFSTPSLANAQSTSTVSVSNSTLQTASSVKPAFAGKYFHVADTGSTKNSNTIGITAETSGMLGTQGFSLSLPAGADIDTLKVTLNGHDVSSQFGGSSGFVTAADGLSTVKNVMSAIVKTSSGGMASGRWRSMTGVRQKSPKGTHIPMVAVSPKATGMAGFRTPAPDGAQVVPAQFRLPARSLCHLCSKDLARQDLRF